MKVAAIIVTPTVREFSSTNPRVMMVDARATVVALRPTAIADLSSMVMVNVLSWCGTKERDSISNLPGSRAAAIA